MSVRPLFKQRGQDRSVCCPLSARPSHSQPLLQGRWCFSMWEKQATGQTQSDLEEGGSSLTSSVSWLEDCLKLKGEHLEAWKGTRSDPWGYFSYLKLSYFLDCNSSLLRWTGRGMPDVPLFFYNAFRFKWEDFRTMEHENGKGNYWAVIYSNSVFNEQITKALSLFVEGTHGFLRQPLLTQVSRATREVFLTLDFAFWNSHSLGLALLFLFFCWKWFIFPSTLFLFSV